MPTATRDSRPTSIKQSSVPGSGCQPPGASAGQLLLSIGVLVLLGVMPLQGRGESSRLGRTATLVDEIASQLSEYRIKHGTLPLTDQSGSWFSKLIADDSAYDWSSVTTTGARNFLLPLDAWGQALVYRPRTGAEGFVLYSVGADGRDDDCTGDDISGWRGFDRRIYYGRIWAYCQWLTRATPAIAVCLVGCLLILGAPTKCLLGLPALVLGITLSICLYVVMDGFLFALAGVIAIAGTWALLRLFRTEPNWVSNLRSGPIDLLCAAGVVVGTLWYCSRLD